MHETVDYDVDEDKDDYALGLTKFRMYCELRKNIVFERYQFWGRNQSEGEPMDQWVTDPSTLVGVHDTRIKERLLREEDLTLARALDVCRAAETSKHQMDTIGAAYTQIHAMHTQKNVTESSWEYISQAYVTSDRWQRQTRVGLLVLRTITRSTTLSGGWKGV